VPIIHTSIYAKHWHLTQVQEVKHFFSAKQWVNLLNIDEKYNDT